MRTMKRIAAATAVVSALTMTAACGSDSSSDTSSDTASSAAPSAPESSPMAPESSAAADPAADLVGKGCAGYSEQVPDGKGSVAGMAADFEKFYRDNNKAAGTRVRLAMQELKTFAQTVRNEVQTIKNEGKPAAEPSDETAQS